MSKKTLKEYVYRGFGFPVVLYNVPVQEIFGEEVLHIDYDDLQKKFCSIYVIRKIL